MLLLVMCNGVYFVVVLVGNVAETLKHNVTKLGMMKLNQ